MLETFASVTTWQGEGWEVDVVVDGFDTVLEAALFGYSIRSLIRGGDRCRFSPTCSQYAIITFREILNYPIVETLFFSESYNSSLPEFELITILPCAFFKAMLGIIGLFLTMNFTQLIYLAFDKSMIFIQRFYQKGEV